MIAPYDKRKADTATKLILAELENLIEKLGDFAECYKDVICWMRNFLNILT